MFQLSESMLWLIPIVLVYSIVIWFIRLYLKDKDKRKLMFSIVFILASADYFLFLINYPIHDNQIIYHLYLISSIPLQIALLIAVTEIIHEIKNFNKIFNVFIAIMIILLFTFPITAYLEETYTAIRIILAFLTITLSIYSFIKTRKTSSIMFSLVLIFFSISSISVKNNLMELAVFSHVVAYIFMALIFTGVLEYGGIESYFSLRDKLKVTQKKLEKSERKYRTIVSSMSDLIFLIDKEDFFKEIYCRPNSKLYRKPEEFIGRKLQDVMPKEVSNKYIENARRVRETGRSQQYEYFLNINGEKRWFEAILDLYEDGESIVARVRDITDRKKMEEELRRSEERYRLIVENTSDVIMLTRTDGIISYLSPSCENVLGYPPEELIGRQPWIVHKDDLDKVKEMHYKALRGVKDSNYEYRIVTKDGITKWVSHSWSPVYENGKMKMVVSIIRDITEKKEMEEKLASKVEQLEKAELAYLNIMQDLRDTIEELKKAKEEITKKNIQLQETMEELQMMNEELNVAREQLTILNKTLEDKVRERTREVEKLLQQKDEFIHQLGHDLKTPLTPLTTLLPIIRKRVDDPKTQELLDTVIQSSLYMKNLVTKTLQLARLNSPTTEFHIENTDLLEEIDKVLERNKTVFKEHNIEVENLISEDILVKADKLRLNELLDNLISNAVKYSPNGGKIKIKAEKENDEIKVAVEDEGMGMTKEQLEHIFDEFYKADPSRHDFESSGLGLPICKKIVEKHGGKIWAESQGIGKGSTFYFTLPSAKQ